MLGSLGAGGMGEVYRARDTKLGRDVAPKILAANDPERRDTRLGGPDELADHRLEWRKPP